MRILYDIETYVNVLCVNDMPTRTSNIDLYERINIAIWSKLDIDAYRNIKENLIVSIYN